MSLERRLNISTAGSRIVRLADMRVSAETLWLGMVRILLPKSFAPAEGGARCV